MVISMSGMFTCRRAVLGRLRGDRLTILAAAWSLILLSALPFTPPFSVCGLSMLLAPQPVLGVTAASSSAVITTGPSATVRASSVLTEEQVKDGMTEPVQRLATLTETVTDLVVVAEVNRAEFRPVLNALRL